MVELGTIDDATLKVIQDAAWGYDYSECSVEEAQRVIDPADSNFCVLGPGQTFSMMSDDRDPEDDDYEPVTIGDGAIVQVVDMGGDFYRIYSAIYQDQGYELTGT